MIGVCLPSQSAPGKHNQEKKSTNLCAPHEFVKKMCRPCFSQQNKQIFRKFSLIDLRFVFSSRALHVLRAQRIIDLLITHKSTRSETSITRKIKLLLFWCLPHELRYLTQVKWRRSQDDISVCHVRTLKDRLHVFQPRKLRSRTKRCQHLPRSPPQYLILFDIDSLCLAPSNV